MFSGILLLILGPCMAAQENCTEKVNLGPGGRFSIVYRSFSLKAKNPRVERALVVIHGAGRNADSYFLSAMAGALIAGALENTVIVAPRLASNSGDGCQDTLAPGEISWTCGGAQDWRRGGVAADADGLYAFDLLDEILRKLARRAVFPNLKTIVVTGHSAGGQVTNRYAASNKVEGELPVPVQYVVSNPSSYLYLDGARLPSGACSEKGGCKNQFGEYADGANCVTYDNWHYGMKQRAGYAASLPEERLRSALVSRDVTYLLGALDTLPLFGFDSSCPAMAQGPNRLARGVTYWNYMRARGAKHTLVTVPACGHNGRCMYTAGESLGVLFPD